METKKMNKKRKEFYMVLDIKQLEELIEEAKRTSCKENVKRKIATAVLRMYEVERKGFEGQMELIKGGNQ